MPNPTTPEALPGFDAVAESRKWKEAVARETAGMSIAERMAHRRHSSVEAIRRFQRSRQNHAWCARNRRRSDECRERHPEMLA